MRELWVQIEESTSQTLKETLLMSAKNLCNTVIVGKDDINSVKSHNFLIASPYDGDIKIIEEKFIDDISEMKRQKKIVCLKLSIKNRVDEIKAIEAIEKGVDYIIIGCPNWKIIPLENLIARSHGKTKLLAEVHNSQEARIALETLELGADGIALKTTNPDEIEKTSTLTKIIKTRSEEDKKAKIELTSAKIISCKPLSMGLRLCIDTCDLMKQGEGMLIGCHSFGMFLIQAEVEESPHIEPRPFRVNAGTIFLYILTPGNKTCYLSELRTGDEVLIVNRNGSYRSGVVGRIKIERRPLILVEADVKGNSIKIIVQNAETIRFVTRDGSKSVSELKPNDEVLIYYQPGGRHFGILVNEESIIER